LVEECREAAQLVAVIRRDDWARIVRCRLHAEVLMIAEERGADGLEVFLDALERRERFFTLSKWVKRKNFAPGSFIGSIRLVG
jgi:hypothetical protein